ncbi:periplasmic heavy metal sensor [Sphingomonas parapaucimobilis]|uniref:Putative heavy metal resistance protein n=1 Tax=Sphingomonas parapaucimobilis NBRC 15100 TaxID=1219049 RepID=A0A0A1W602_9SPHN|nr:periplasmic heavy metal sensor [Sphingomonas parapaucimobilis]GAM00586.1 putative heavy metal resistance protein [Sphingomonas parapaucimobilis NBRC 15100]
MSGAVRRNLLTLAIAFVAALAGVAIGCRLLMPAAPQASDIHMLVHRDIALDPGQRIALDRLEGRFAVQRAALEARLRGDNARLAAAIEAEHRDGPQVTQAIDAVHHSMGDLQKATLAHVFAMRRVLRPDQAATFDRLVAAKLTDTGR